jgi:hypothetical protein
MPGLVDAAGRRLQEFVRWQREALTFSDRLRKISP